MNVYILRLTYPFRTRAKTITKAPVKKLTIFYFNTYILPFGTCLFCKYKYDYCMYFIYSDMKTETNNNLNIMFKPKKYKSHSTNAISLNKYLTTEYKFHIRNKTV